MKSILLSEGKYDVFLLKELYEKYDYKIDTFLREEFEGSKPQNKQTDAIRNFLEARSPYDILIKSEGNKNNLLKYFPSVVIYLIRNTEKVIILIDLDSDDEKGLISIKETLSKEIEDTHSGGNFEIESFKKIKSNKYFTALEANIKPVGKFWLVGCKPNLDDIAGIDKEDDSREQKKDKILDLLDDDTISNLLQEILIF